MDVFLHFFEAKSPGKKLWVSFNGVAGRVLLTLFQQSYEASKRTLLDGFPLYWVGKLKFRKPTGLEELAPPDRELCQVLASLGAVFNTAQLIKHEYSPSYLKGYIGLFLLFPQLVLHIACLTYALHVLYCGSCVFWLMVVYCV